MVWVRRFMVNYQIACFTVLAVLITNVSIAGEVRVVDPPGYEVALTPVTHDTSARILKLEASPATNGDVLIYFAPLLWNSPDPPLHFGTLSPGQYDLSFSFKLPNTPTQLQVSWVGDSTTDPPNNPIHTQLDITDLSGKKWYRVTGTVEVTGETDWRGRCTLVVKSTTDPGAHDPDIHAELDDVQLMQGGRHFFRRDFDFESDPVGVLPTGTHAVVTNGAGESIRVVDNLPWQRLPEWYQRDRVQIHTRLNAHDLNWGVDKKVFADAPIHLSGMGVPSWTRHVKTGREGPWWPTAVPTSSSIWWPKFVNDRNFPGGRDVAREIIDRTHAQDMRLITYYWMMSEAQILNELDPSYAALQPNGSQVDNRGVNICLDSPYRETVVRGRLMELTARGADGIYFDEKHNLIDGCWCPHTVAEFEAAGMGTMPEGKNFVLPAYRNLLRLYGRTIRDTFVDYHQAVHSVNSDTVLVVSASTLPSLWDPRMPTAFAEILHAPKNEFSHPWVLLETLFTDEDKLDVQHPGDYLPDRDIQMAFGYTLLRDTANARPPHMWVFNPARIPGNDPADVDSYVSSQQLLTAAASLMTYGCVANLDIREANIEGGDARYVPAVQTGNLVGPMLAGAHPIRWVGIHFNEVARDTLYKRAPDVSPVKDNYLAAWNQVLAPALYAFESLWSHGVPASVVTDGQLERRELYGFQKDVHNAFDVLFLPSNVLNAAQAASIQEFVDRGGLVIRSEERGWVWYTAAGRQTAVPEFLAALPGSSLTDGRITGAPVQIRNCMSQAVPVLPHVAAYEEVDDNGDRRILVAMGNRFAWLVDDSLDIDARRDFVPAPVTGPLVYLRHGLVTAEHQFRYTTEADATWHDVPATWVTDSENGSHVYVDLTDVSFASILVLEALPPDEGPSNGGEPDGGDTGVFPDGGINADDSSNGHWPGDTCLIPDGGDHAGDSSDGDRFGDDSAGNTGNMGSDSLIIENQRIRKGSPISHIVIHKSPWPHRLPQVKHQVKQ